MAEGCLEGDRVFVDVWVVCCMKWQDWCVIGNGLGCMLYEPEVNVNLGGNEEEGLMNGLMKLSGTVGELQL